MNIWHVDLVRRSHRKGRAIGVRSPHGDRRAFASRRAP